jgi:FtsP/CotA-like multicopper oxidase with cupredoxin domain
MPPSRREVLKTSFTAIGTAVVVASLPSSASGDEGGSGSTLVSSSGLRSPFVTPWVDPLYIPPVLTSLPLTEDPANPGLFVTPPPGITFQEIEPAAHGLAEGYTHQRCDEFKPKKFYQLDVSNTNWSFHSSPALQPAPLFTYNGAIPGPMIHARYGEPIVVRVNNKLDPTSQGFGMPDTATHLHNMHSASESDGYPSDFVPRTADPVNQPHYRDHHYAMVAAGCDQIPGTGDERECMGTLWYHDHRIDHTAENVYRGLFGFFNAFDELDSGEETDPSPALGLPSGEFDIMLGFVDPQFDAAGKIFFDVFDTDGHLGDKVAVNGKIQPFLDVQRRKYRFRLLDIGPSRYYQFFLSKGLPTTGQTKFETMTLIANDGNLLPGPLPLDNILMTPAQRMDLIVDFSQYKAGDEIYLVNRMQQTTGRGPDYKLMDPGYPVLKFIVQGTVPAPDPSKVPALLRPLSSPTPAELAGAVHRSWEFARSNGAWTVNGVFFDTNVVRASVKRAPVGSPATTEIWTIKNGGGGWSHPIHIHFEEFQILSRNGAPPALFERGRKDVVNIGPGDEVKVFFRFRDFTGRYVMHCHNVVHEDHAMMIRFDIVD